MRALFVLVAQVNKLLYLIAAACLVSMMLITLVDVISRFLFGATSGEVNVTFIGGVELVRFALLFAVIFTLPLAVDKSQVIVDLFTDNWSENAKRFFEAFYMVGYVLLGLGMSFAFQHMAIEATTYMETTQDLLLPISYIYWISMVGSAWLGISALAASIQIALNTKED